MIRKLPSSLNDYWAILLRRKWWIIGSIVGISSIVLLASMRLPKLYKSQTVILVQPQKLPDEYVKATVTTDVTDQLETISEEVMSSSRLAMIVDQLDLYPSLRQKRSMDDIIAMMRKDITVEVLTEGNSERHGAGAFSITYMASSPDAARDVTRKLADLFIQENLGSREQQAKRAQQFLAAEAEKARQQLEAQEAKIKAFNAKHMGALPEQEQTNLQLMSQYQQLEQSNSEAMARAAEQRTYLQSMVNIAGKKEKKLPPPPSPTQLELQKKKQELAAARQKYTDSFPDVVRLKGEAAALQQQVNMEPAPAPVETSAEPNQTDQFHGQIASLNQEISTRNSKESELEGQIHGLQARIQVLPQVQSEFADLNRDYQEMQKNYQSLLEKQSASGMAAEMEQHAENDQFQVLDPANLPSKPFWPNLAMINGAGFMASVLVGLMLALFFELRDVAIRDARDVEQYLSLPIISSIPHISSVLAGPQSGRQLPAKAT